MNARIPIVLALVLLPAPAPAQTPSGADVLAVGGRVRVQPAGDGSRIQGVVLAVDRDHVTLAPDGSGPVRMRIDSIERLEASAGHRRHGMRGLVIGGATLGLIGVFDSVDPDDCGDDSMKWCSRGEAIGYGALTGALLGYLIGAAIQTEQWVPVRIQGPTSRTEPAAVEVVLPL